MLDKKMKTPPDKKTSWLQDALRPNVYGPDESLPQPGKKEPIFGQGLVPLLIEVGVVILFWWLGIFRLIARAVEAIFSTLR